MSSSRSPFVITQQKISEYGQEIQQSHTVDQPTASLVMSNGDHRNIFFSILPSHSLWILIVSYYYALSTALSLFYYIVVATLGSGFDQVICVVLDLFKYFWQSNVFLQIFDIHRM